MRSNRLIKQMVSWLKKKGDAGWTSVAVEADGLYGVTVLPPHKPGGKPRVVKYASIPGDQLDIGSLTELSKNISASGCPWALSLSRKEYNIMVVQEPSVQREEFDHAVRWLISDMIDFPAEDASVAWMQIPTVELLPNRPSNIYVLLAKQNILSGYATLFQNAGISLQAIDVRETAQRNIAALAGKAGEGAGMLVIEKVGTQFTVTFNNELYLDRFIQESLLSEDMDADARAQSGERIVLQIQRSLDFIARNMPFIDIHRILMAPMPDNLDMGDFISPHLHVPVEKLDLASIFDFSQTPELAREENQAHYFSALGGALRSICTAQQTNLLHRKELDLGFIKPALAALGLVLLSLLGLWGVRQDDVAKARQAEAASAQQLQEANAKLQHLMSGTGLEAEFAALKPQAEIAQKIMDQANTLGTREGHSKYFSLLASISEDGLWLTNVIVDKSGKSVVINGRALHKESVMRYARRLNALFADSGVQFTSLEMRHETFGKQGDSNTQYSNVSFKLY